MTTLVGRKVYLDWGDGKVIAIEVYPNNLLPKHVKFTPGKIGGIPKLYDLHNFAGEVIELNPQDTAMVNPEGHDLNTYITSVFKGEKDEEF